VRHHPILIDGGRVNAAELLIQLPAKRRAARRMPTRTRTLEERDERFEIGASTLQIDAR
jgi:hypothetical protein